MGAAQEVDAAQAAYYHAFETGDLDAMSALWLEAPDSICVHPGALPVRGAGAIRRSWALIMANTPYIQFILTDTRVSLRGDAASITCTENVLTSHPGGLGDGFTGTEAVATNVFVRTAHGWRLWIHHASPVVSGGSHDD